MLAAIPNPLAPPGTSASLSTSLAPSAESCRAVAPHPLQLRAGHIVLETQPTLAWGTSSSSLGDSILEAHSSLSQGHFGAQHGGTQPQGEGGSGGINWPQALGGIYLP